MNERDRFDLSEDQAEALRVTATHPQAAGPPLPTRMNQHAAHPSAEENANRSTPPPPGRTVETESAEAAQSPGVQRAVSILRAAVPFVQGLLPLLDGNVGSALSNLIAPRSRPQAAAPSAELDLAPIEDGLAQLRSQQHNLRLQTVEQSMMLKRVEDQLETVRQATGRIALEQQELVEDLKAFGKSVKIVAMVALVLAAASFFMTLAIFLRMNKLLP
jgi:hypothetical protein